MSTSFELQLAEYLYGQSDAVELLSAPNPLPEHVYFCTECGFIGSHKICDHCNVEIEV